MEKTFEIPTGNGQYKTVTAKNKSQALGMTVASGVKPKLNKLSVTGYTDNPDGTTTNFLNDGTQETGTYTTNKDKSLTFNPTITADNLTPTNTPVIPPAVNTQTEKNNLNNTLATLTPTADEIAQTNAENLAKTNRPIDTTAERINEIAGIRAGQGADVQQYSDTVGTTEAAKALNESNKALTRLEASYKEQVDKINANAEGKFGGAVQQELNDAERSYLDTKYKLNIDKLVAQGDVDTAKGLVDQYIAYKYEPLENELKTLTTLYGLYQNDMTESEKLQAQQAYQQKQDELDFNRQKDLLDYKASIDARTKSTGIGGGNQYATDLDAIIGNTLAIIPTKFGQQTFSSQIARARNDADKLNIVASQVLKNAPATDRTDFKNQSIGVSFIDKAINELDSGVKTGAINNAAQYTYNIFGKDFDPKIAKINGYITSAIQPYRNSVTGAAWGTQEDNEYEALFGSTKYSPTELRQRLVQMKEMLIAKSTEGLNAYVNPLNTYSNPFIYNTSNNSINVNGQNYIVGQIYNDGTANWVVDANGNWSKQ